MKRSCVRNRECTGKEGHLKLNHCRLAIYFACLTGAFFAKGEDTTNRFVLEPVFTRYAQTYDRIVIDLRQRYFDDLRLKEVDHFDGYTTDLSVTVPFKERFEISAYFPLYTYGHATRTDVPGHQRIHINGPGAVFDYPSIYFAHQVLTAARHALNAGYFLGAGGHMDDWGQLHTTHKDILNHQGTLFHGGLRADRFFADQKWRLAGNAAVRYYDRSDDLNPSGGSDQFYHVETSGAAVYHPDHFFVHPAVEVKFRGDLETYNAAWIVPQLLIPVCRSFEVRVGVPLRVTRDGERFGVNLHLTGFF
jgi:hypothetical protein